MALLWTDDGWTWDGEAVTDARVAARRDAQIAAWGDELARIAGDELGEGQSVAAVEFPLSRIDRFARRFRRRVGEIVTAAYVFAAGGAAAVTAAGWGTIAGLMERQDEFARGFIDALRRGELSPAMAVARARLYAGAAVGAFERGKAAQRGFDPPATPGDGDTPCRGNCRCWWEIEELVDRFEATWHARDDANVCTVCADRATEWNPYVQER